MKMSYLGENCPNCGTYRVLPYVVNKKQVGGHCLSCGYEWELSEERTKELKRRLNEQQRIS